MSENFESDKPKYFRRADSRSRRMLKLTAPGFNCTIEK